MSIPTSKLPVIIWYINEWAITKHSNFHDVWKLGGEHINVKHFQGDADVLISEIAFE